MGVYRSHHAADDEVPDAPHADEAHPGPPYHGGPPDPATSRSSGTVYGRPRDDSQWDDEPTRHQPYGDPPDPHDDPAPNHADHYDADRYEADQPQSDRDVDWEAELDRRRAARTDEPDPPLPRRRDPMAPVRAGVRGFGELLITFGLVVLLFAGYEIWGKAARVDAAQNKLDDKIEDVWGDQEPGAEPTKATPLPGDAIARLYIPKLDKRWVVVEGVAPGDIKNAPGHYPKSAMAGKVGNFAIAGHRAKSMFWDLDKLRPGDKIYLEDRTHFYVYVITETKIVLPNAVEVVAPVPGKPGEKPTDAMLTMTTCNPKWDNYERLIVHAKHAEEPRPKSAGMPPELEG